MKILVIDVGGTHVKVRATSHKGRMEIPSGPKITARKMVAAVRKLIVGWQYEAITIGYPGAVLHGHIVGEPHNLGHGWVGFNFQMPYKNGRTYEDYVGLAGLKRLGKKKCRRHVNDVVKRLKTALEAGYVVLGGGNARLLKKLPPGARLGDNTNAFRGGYPLWANDLR